MSDCLFRYVDLPGNLEDSRVYLPFLSRYNAIYVVIASVSSSAAPGSTQLLAELKSSFSYWLSALSRHVGVAPGTRSASTLSWRIQLVCTMRDAAGDAGLLQKVSDELMQWARVTFGHLPIAEKLLPVTLRDVSAVSRSINALAADVTREDVRCFEVWSEISNYLHYRLPWCLTISTAKSPLHSRHWRVIRQ